MHWLRTTGRLLRTLFAVLFGLISLVHLPIMTATAAKAAASSAFSASPPLTATTDHAHHQHHDRGQMHASNGASYVPPVPGCDMICLGCLQSLTPVLGDAPVMHSLALAMLGPAPSNVMRDAPADPAVPPPRLQA